MIAGQMPLPVGLRDSSVFASFFAGSNRAIVDTLLALGTRSQPVCTWLHGPRASGKTHLLQASCVNANEQGTSSAYVPMRVFAQHPDAITGYGELGLVALDDIELIVGHAGWEPELFRLHQQLEERGGRLLVASQSVPGALGFKLRDLASRLNGGVVLTLQALGEQEQQHALQMRAALRGFELPEETIQYLQRRLPRDMEHLCAFLDQLDRASLVAQRKLTVPFVREVLEDLKTSR